ncbi:MAG TPA: polysaccharide biosynthesis/export family protein [Nitrospiria bacterium]|nr:polysaccharide biosynthesis/export family protein [Nitrospiria bacterium]
MIRKAIFFLSVGFFLVSCISTKQALCSIAPCLPGQGSVPVELASEHQEEDMFSDYVIGPEDVVEISVWKNDALSKTVTVRPDGKISLPLIGDVQAAGLTASELKKTITKRLLEYKETPEVSVIVKEVNSYMVYITGEVVHPGKYPLKSRATLLQGITLAGGFTQFASKNNMVLLRRDGAGEIRIQVKYDDIVFGKKGSVDPFLLPGDTVVVP